MKLLITIIMLICLYQADFMACNNAEDSVINFDAAPSWLHEGGDLSRPLRDPTGRELGEWISRIVSCKSNRISANMLKQNQITKN